MFSKRFLEPIFALCLLFCLLGARGFSQVPDVAPPPAAPGTVNLSIKWLETLGINQPTPAGQTSLDVVYDSNGKEVTVSLPVTADTYLWKNSPTPAGHGAGLLLRDGRYSEGLLQLDLSSLPKDATIKQASLKFKVGGVQNKQQPGSFSCYQVLTPWTEDATWAKPEPSAADWNGLKPDHDFKATAFAQLDVPILDDKQKGGQILEITGFETMLQQWVSGAAPNNGFLLTFSGKALQLSIPAREAVFGAHNLLLGGERTEKIFVSPNLPELNRILLKPDDLLSAKLAIFVTKVPPAAALASAAQLNVYESDDAGVTTGKLLGSVPVKNLSALGEVELVDLAPELKNLLASSDSKQGFVISIEGGTGALPEIQTGGAMDRKLAPGLNLVLHDYPAAQLFGDVPIHPQPGIYTKVVDGHLNYGGQRLRLWGVVGFPYVDRLAKMGFNAQRVWEPGDQGFKQGEGAYTEDSVKKGVFTTYQKGDGSRLDKADAHMADLKAHGFFIMFAGLSTTMPFEPLMADDSFVAGGDDWAQWKEAIAVKMAGNPYHYLFVDDRLQKIKKTHARNLLTHVNLYTGKAYGEDENIAIYEIFNENGFVASMLGGEMAKWPPFFTSELQKKWNQWLVDHYKDDAGLTKAWGTLGSGESLASGTIKPAPDFAARAQYPEKRGDDFIEFMVDLENSFNQDFRSYCRSLFPAGVGVNVVPFSFDTFYRPNLQWSYTQSLGDVHSMGMYFWDLKSSLDKPPGAYVIDSFTPANMPTVLYETNEGRPSAYRAEYPIKVAALASYQDWDGVFFHYWSPTDNPADVAYLSGTLAPSMPEHYWTSVQHQIDPVMCSAMALGSRIFLNHRIPPAKAPEVFTVGKQALFSYSVFRGIDIADATFTTGSRLLYKPGDDSALTLDGKPVPPSGRIQQALTSGDYVTWDWPNARLIIDAPNVKAYIGKVDGNFQFSDGITLGDVSTPWISFTMVSADGKPFTGPDATKKILMDGVFDAKNTDFSFDYSVEGGPLDQAKAVHNLGHEPVLVDKVEYKVWFPNQFEGTLKNYDFALRETNTADIANNNLVVQQGATPFMDTIDITNWGGKGTLPVAQPTAIVKQDYVRANQAVAAAGSGASGGASGAIAPIPGVDWTMDYAATSHSLQNSTLIFTSISKPDPTQGATKTMTVTGAQLPTLWNSQADLVLTFTAGKMTKIDITFIQPPPVEEVVADFSKALGEPIEKKIEAQTGTTEIHWPAKPQSPDVFVTESQGQMKILYQPPGA